VLTVGVVFVIAGDCCGSLGACKLIVSLTRSGLLKFGGSLKLGSTMLTVGVMSLVAGDSCPAGTGESVVSCS
jgi:hypothetical protein